MESAHLLERRLVLEKLVELQNSLEGNVNRRQGSEQWSRVAARQCFVNFVLIAKAADTEDDELQLPVTFAERIAKYIQGSDLSSQSRLVIVGEQALLGPKRVSTLMATKGLLDTVAAFEPRPMYVHVNISQALADLAEDMQESSASQGIFMQLLSGRGASAFGEGFWMHADKPPSRSSKISIDAESDTTTVIFVTLNENPPPGKVFRKRPPRSEVFVALRRMCLQVRRFCFFALLVADN